MRFDSAKALETFQELGDRRFTGPDSEKQVAELVAERFAQMGLNLERREVVGSAFPQRVAPWVGSLGYGVLITGAYLLVLPNTSVSSVLAFILLIMSGYWCNAVFFNRIQLGRRRPPLKAAPVVVASMKMEPAPPLRVVIQALVGGLEPDLSPLLRWPRFGIPIFLTVCSTLLILDILACKVMLGLARARQGWWCHTTS